MIEDDDLSDLLLSYDPEVIADVQRAQDQIARGEVVWHPCPDCPTETGHTCRTCGKVLV